MMYRSGTAGGGKNLKQHQSEKRPKRTRETRNINIVVKGEGETIDVIEERWNGETSVLNLIIVSPSV